MTPLPERVERKLHKGQLGSRGEMKEGREKNLRFMGDTVPYMDVIVGEGKVRGHSYPCAERQVARAYLPVDGVLKAVFIGSLSPKRQFQNES